MPHATVDGRRLLYVRRGHGPPLLLIQGMSGNHLHWCEQFLAALEADFELIAYDHRGIGGSDPARGAFTIADLADDGAGLLGALGLESAHVLGISMGGMVAQELALRHPERVRSLTLGATYAGGEGSALTDPATAQRLAGTYMGDDRERALQVFWEINVSAGFAASDAQAFAEFREVAVQMPASLELLMAQFQAISGHDASARLARIAAPTLVIHGTEDQMLPATNARAIADRIPGARLELLDGTGHMFFWEQPDRVAALIREHATSAAPAAPATRG